MLEYGEQMFIYSGMSIPPSPAVKPQQRQDWQSLQKEVRTLFPGAFPDPPTCHGTGYFGWDADLHGGWREGVLQECLVDSGNAGLGLWLDQLWQTVAEEGQFGAYLDGASTWDVATVPESVRSRVLWVRPPRIDQMISAAEVVVRDGHFKWVLMDFLGASPKAKRRFPSSQWYRLQRLAQRTRTILIVLARTTIIPGSHRRFILEGPVFTLRDQDTPRADLWPRLRWRVWSGEEEVVACG